MGPNWTKYDNPTLRPLSLLPNEVQFYNHDSRQLIGGGFLEVVHYQNIDGSLGPFQSQTQLLLERG